jgi:hypothetical protein
LTSAVFQVGEASGHDGYTAAAFQQEVEFGSGSCSVPFGSVETREIKKLICLTPSLLNCTLNARIND